MNQNETGKVKLTNKLLAAAQPEVPEESADQTTDEVPNEVPSEEPIIGHVEEPTDSEPDVAPTDPVPDEVPTDLVATEDLEGGMLIAFVGHVATVVHNPEGAPTKARLLSSGSYVDLSAFKQYQVLQEVPEGTHRPIHAGSMSTVNLITRDLP